MRNHGVTSGYIEPEHITGEWVMVRPSPDHMIGYVTCNRCGKSTKQHMLFKFCPNCGARMENDDDNIAQLRIITLQQLKEEINEPSR